MATMPEQQFFSWRFILSYFYYPNVLNTRQFTQQFVPSVPVSVNSLFLQKCVIIGFITLAKKRNEEKWKKNYRYSPMMVEKIVYFSKIDAYSYLYWNFQRKYENSTRSHRNFFCKISSLRLHEKERLYSVLRGLHEISSFKLSLKYDDTCKKKRK